VTAILDISATGGVLSMRDCIDLLEGTLAHEETGRTSVSPKFTTAFEGGAMRVLFAADPEAGYCAMKAYHNVAGHGARYVVMLYRLSDGELVAVIDGRKITDLRTGAASGVAARRVAIAEPVRVGIIGSGNQARTQLESLAAVYCIESARVYSPTAKNREAYAQQMSVSLGFPVLPVDSAQAAVAGCNVVVTATKARADTPIVKAGWLGACRLLCAVGNTRRQYSELDEHCFRDARLVIVDSTHALHEAGELIRATEAGFITQERSATLAKVVTGAVTVPREGLIVFKSVGMALQDLALAARYYELLKDRPGTIHVPSVATLRTSSAA
jgi:alanine dehydrogenase